MFGWKRRALDAEARLARAEYHFDVVFTLSDGSIQKQSNICVVDGTLDVWAGTEPGHPEIVRARVLVHKVVDGVLVNSPAGRER